MQAISPQRYQSWAVPQLETTMLDLIRSSCANLTQDAKISALAGSLGTFANLEIPEYNLPADVPELTDEETATAVISQLIGEATHRAMAMLKDSLIREEPTSKAAVVCQVKKGETVTVIGDASYYYLVEVIDPDTDERLSGYISKKSVKPTQKESD